MSTGSQEWIAESLARLEQLEQERDAHEAELERADDATALRAHSEAIDRLDEEIRQLYATLEAVASDEDEEVPAEPGDEVIATNEFQRIGDEIDPGRPAANPLAASVPPATSSFAQPAPSPFAQPAPSPFVQPAAGPFAQQPTPPVAASPFDAPPSTNQAVGFVPAPDFADYAADIDDVPSGGGKGKWIVAAAGVVAVAGVVIWSQVGKSPAAPVAPPVPTEVQVIKASAVPPDTQGPKSAEGADVTATPEREYTESERSAPSNRSRSRSRGSRPKNDRQAPQEDARKIKVGGGEDPFG